MGKRRPKKNSPNDPFLQRAVEHWLDSANELGYQPLFCAWLSTRGFVLKYSIRNTNFEQGKDVLAVSPSGVPHGFQLKGGNISLNRWRTEVKPEIDALVECALQHPDIDPRTKHVSYLVTNGEIDDSVRSEIVALNQGRWRATPLRYWTRGDLLTGFQGMAAGIFPTDAAMYKRLIDLIFADGRGLPDLERLSSFLGDLLKLDSALKKEQRKRDIAAAFVYLSMISGTYRAAGNHSSVVQVLTVLLAHTLYLADRYALEDRYWLESFEIAWGDLVATSLLLEDELKSGGFDPSFASPLDIELKPFRKYPAMACIVPLKLSQLISGDERWRDFNDPAFAAKLQGSVHIWGEGASQLSFQISLLLHASGDSTTAESSLCKTIDLVLKLNGRSSREVIGLLSPYYDITFVLKFRSGLLGEEVEDSTKLRSYTLKPFFEQLVRLGSRPAVEERWKEISFMRLEEFVISKAEDFYMIRAAEGENLTILPKAQKSWSELVAESSGFTGTTIPKGLKRFPMLLPFLVAIFPFRFTSDVAGFLHELVSSSLSRKGDGS